MSSVMYRVSVIIAFFCAMPVAVCVAKQPAGSVLPDLMISSEGSYWQTGTFTEVTSGTVDVTVNENSRKQAWEGFGGTFNEMGWDALSVISSKIPKAMALLFNANDGANFVYGRVPIGANDYSMSWYTLDETAGDYAMEKFSIAHNQFQSDGGGLRITCKGDGYRIALPSRGSGRIDLLTLTGRVLESRAIPQGSREIPLPRQASHAGLLLVRVVYGGRVKTARLFTAR